jgi:hypothetical protein
VKLEDLPEALKQLVRERPRQLAQAQTNKIQDVYDRVLRDGSGRSIEDVKILLAHEWRSSFGSDLAEPELSQVAAELAAGNRIKVKLKVS